MANDVNVFLNNLVEHGLETYRSFYGDYKATVYRNDDPEGRGRIQVTMAPFSEGSPLDVWVEPRFEGAGPDRGWFWPPEVGDSVWIRFGQGRTDRPLVYTGGAYRSTNKPKEFAVTDNKPYRRGLVTRGGHMLIFSDEPGKESVRIVRHKPVSDPSLTNRSVSADRTEGKNSVILLEPNGDIRIQNDNNSLLHLDAANEQMKWIDQHGNSITTDGDGIKLVDKSGNLIAIDGGKINIIATGDVTVNAPTFTAETGGTNLSKQASEPVVLGRTYTVARAAMHGQVAAALQAGGGFMNVFGPAAQTLAAALAPGMPASASASALAAALLPFFQATAPMAIVGGALSTAAAGAVIGFESAAPSYLSLVTKTA